jgi:hypothetical protein
MNNSINLNDIEVKKAMRIMMANSGTESLAMIARELGMVETTFRSAINNDAIKLKHFLKAAEVMGYRVIIEKGEQQHNEDKT